MGNEVCVCVCCHRRYIYTCVISLNAVTAVYICRLTLSNFAISPFWLFFFQAELMHRFCLSFAGAKILVGCYGVCGLLPQYNWTECNSV